MALERMDVLDENKISRTLHYCTVRLPETDMASKKNISEQIQELYDVRPDIAYNRLHKLTPNRVHSALVMASVSRDGRCSSYGAWDCRRIGSGYAGTAASPGGGIAERIVSGQESG